VTRREADVKYLFLLHGDADDEAGMTREERMAVVQEHMAYSQKLRDLGAYVSGEALDDPAKSFAVRPGEEPLVSDGPFTATKEALGGFYVVDVPDRDEAIRLASQVPRGPGLVVEVIPIVDV
jgi:hypothetical protein